MLLWDAIHNSQWFLLEVIFASWSFPPADAFVGGWTWVAKSLALEVDHSVLGMITAVVCLAASLAAHGHFVQPSYMGARYADNIHHPDLGIKTTGV